MSRALSLPGLQVTLIGRIWVTAEDSLPWPICVKPSGDFLQASQLEFSKHAGNRYLSAIQSVLVQKTSTTTRALAPNGFEVEKSPAQNVSIENAVFEIPYFAEV